MIKNAVTLWKKLQLNFAATSSVSSSLVTSQYWKSTAVIRGYKHRKKGPMTDNEQLLADELSAFCSRFDQWDFVAAQKQPMARVWMLPAEPVIISEDNMHHAFCHINFRSVSSPDNASGKTLKLCSNWLVYASPLEGCIPCIWKTSTVILVPKKRSPSWLNDCRPVSLTSVPFKCTERIMLK